MIVSLNERSCSNNAFLKHIMNDQQQIKKYIIYNDESYDLLAIFFFFFFFISPNTFIANVISRSHEISIQYSCLRIMTTRLNLSTTANNLKHERGVSRIRCFTKSSPTSVIHALHIGTVLEQHIHTVTQSTICPS